tara:strand:- start:550 stop:936 length:387 start_codon:yes stop_codon:yes gene_type:complete
MKNESPLSPHIQVYSWHISSLVSITHRITGILNISIMTLICFWVFLLLMGENNYDSIQKFLQSFFGKLTIISIIWSFSFQALSELRHLFWDIGLGFELKTSNVTGLLVIFGSFFLTVVIFILGKNFII